MPSPSLTPCATQERFSTLKFDMSSTGWKTVRCGTPIMAQDASDASMPPSDTSLISSLRKTAYSPPTPP